MLKRIVRIIARVFAVLVLLVLALLAVVLVRSRRTFEAPYPVIRATRDPNVVARGRYIVYGPGHCVSCHVSPEEQKAVAEGATPPLAGGNPFVLPVGTIYTRNLTPDRE